MTERERYWRDTAEMHARLTDHANLEADLIALDGVDLDPDAILAPCALTPGAGVRACLTPSLVGASSRHDQRRDHVPHRERV